MAKKVKPPKPPPVPPPPAPVPSVMVALVWMWVAGADGYWVQVGTQIGEHDVLDVSVYNALTYTAVLPRGTWWVRVTALTASGTLGVSTPDQEVTV